MVGGAAEAILLELRDAVSQRLGALGRPVPRGFGGWRAKTVDDALRLFLDQQRALMPRDLQEATEAHWGSFVHQVRPF